MKSSETLSGGPVMREVEVTRDREVADELLVFEVAHAWRPDAGVRQPVVQPRRRAVAQVVADGQVNRRHHLQQDEQRADEPEHAAHGCAALHGR